MKLLMTVSITHTHLLIHHWLAEERQMSWTIWSLKNRQFWVRVTVWSHSHSGVSWGKTFRHKAILMQPSERICSSSKWKYLDKHPMFNNRVSQWHKAMDKKLFYLVTASVYLHTKQVARYRCACVEHLQTGLWPQPGLCQNGPTHPAAAADQRKPAATPHNWV